MTARTYRGMHRRLQRLHGAASAHPCAAPACERQAADWALIGEPTHMGPVERSAQRFAYWSTNLDDFAPLCRSHHRMLDAGGDWTYCPRAHLRAVVGTTQRGECRACKRQRGRRAHTSRTRGAAGQPATTERTLP